MASSGTSTLTLNDCKRFFQMKIRSHASSRTWVEVDSKNSNLAGTNGEKTAYLPACELVSDICGYFVRATNINW